MEKLITTDDKIPVRAGVGLQKGSVPNVGKGVTLLP